MRINVIRTIAPERDLVELLDHDNEPAIVDLDGEIVMRVPPILLAVVVDQRHQDMIMKDYLQQYELVSESAFENGKSVGKASVRREVQALLGLDRIADALDDLADRSGAR